MKLTDKRVQNARPVAGKVVKLSDGGGLQLWVTPSGGKLWNLAYRFAGKQRKLAIGPYPTFSLKDARARREEAKRQLGDCLDPSQQKQLAKLAKANEQANTFGAIAADSSPRAARRVGPTRRSASWNGLSAWPTPPSLGGRSPRLPLPKF